MNAKKTIRKIFLLSLWLCISGGVLVLLIAAIGKKNREHCSDFTITIRDRQNNFFIDEKDVSKLLQTAMNGKIKGEHISNFNLRKLEQLLKDNSWIENAELYFDNPDVLHVTVTERTPVARIFTSTNSSFYIDSNGRQMPLSEKMSAKVPVFTNFPDKKFLTAKDSVLLNDIKKIACFILNDPFWMAQVEQVDISKDRTFEITPTIGNQVIKLGDGADMEKKFRRLLIFYQQVLSKTGFEKYNVIDVQYAGQVIGTKEKINKVDSVQLKLNIEKLLNEAQQMQDSAAAAAVNNSVNLEQQTAPQNFVAGETSHSHSHPNPPKTNVHAKPNFIRKPKAVMH